jgi:hypothetical protein
MCTVLLPLVDNPIPGNKYIQTYKLFKVLERELIGVRLVREMKELGTPDDPNG